MKLAGHIQLMDEKRMSRGVLEGNITAKRPVGKPMKEGLMNLK
jgi:hypothetical protein